MNDPILQEIYDVRRRHWEEAGGTWEGLCSYYRKFSEEFERKGPDVMLCERLEARRQKREADALALADGAMMVCEGKPPNYQTTKLADGETDLARKGEKGE